MLSRGFDRIFSMSCNMGVMPEPPATMPMYFFMLAVYSNFLNGPLNSTLSPTFNSPNALRGRAHVRR